MIFPVAGQGPPTAPEARTFAVRSACVLIALTDVVLFRGEACGVPRSHGCERCNSISGKERALYTSACRS